MKTSILPLLNPRILLANLRPLRLCFTLVFGLLMLSGCSQSPADKLKEMGVEVSNESTAEQVRKGEIETVKLLLEAGMDVNYDDQKVGSLLFNAIHVNNVEMLTFLLEQGADPNQKNGNTNTPLIKLTREFDNLEGLNALVEHGADIHLGNSSNRTPIMYAINSNYPRLALRLVELGANLTAADDFGTSPALLAANMNNAELLNRIFEAGADANMKNPNGSTLLLMASSNIMYEGVLDTFIKYGADIHVADANQTSVLMKVAMSGELRDLKVLLEAGADVSKVNSVGRSALYYAIDSKDLEKLKALVEAGSDVTILDRYNTSILVKAAQAGNKDMVEYILSLKKIDPKTKDSEGLTALDYAEQFKYDEIVALLKS